MSFHMLQRTQGPSNSNRRHKMLRVKRGMTACQTLFRGSLNMSKDRHNLNIYIGFNKLLVKLHIHINNRNIDT